MLGLFASIKLLGAYPEIRYTVLLHISLEPAELAIGISSFSKKVHASISDNLYNILGETGNIYTSIILDVTHCGGTAGYRKQIVEKPSPELFTKVNTTLDGLMDELEKDLVFAIVKKAEFKAQRISFSPSIRGGKI